MIDGEKLWSIRAASIQKYSDGVIAAGPLSKQPMTKAYRIVLLEQDDGKFVVCSQCFDFDEFGDVTQYSRGDGDYFKQSDLVRATDRFAQRVKIHAGYLQSLYREEEAVEQAAK